MERKRIIFRENFNVNDAYKRVGFSYIGNVSSSAKTMLSEKNGTMTYCIYLAPANMSGYEVCPNSAYCRHNCLNGSGRNIGDTITHEGGISNINRSRIKKTRLFYEDRALFMRLLIHEIKVKRSRAERLGYEFAVRINGTSDLSPVLFKDPDTGLNILDLFKDIQFYDYTKIPSRMKLAREHDNYFLVLSYNGHNWDECREFLDNGGNVAVVFHNRGNDLPRYFRGYPVCDGNKHDIRYLDPVSHIVGLHYHKTANDYVRDENGINRFMPELGDFVVNGYTDDCDW